ncbi:MAG: hypothetical protein EAZ66_07205 [Alphaproteobacteria bacterium]|nr:MAG: hypothetical protein EAZ66_07205 [Alphaproteobacteria bacterium]
MHINGLQTLKCLLALLQSQESTIQQLNVNIVVKLDTQKLNVSKRNEIINFRIILKETIIKKVKVNQQALLILQPHNYTWHMWNQHQFLNIN